MLNPRAEGVADVFGERAVPERLHLESPPVGQAVDQLQSEVSRHPASKRKWL